ncbi:MAG: FkbM family methyltransferase, partial [Alphaproteobacteria bacterium]|nr:FkbM family methyltransferase [Alphaproteobacteria bacterium]
GGDARIWSFEPTPEVAEMLERSVALNGFAGVMVQRLALGERNGETGFQRGEFSALNRIGEGMTMVPLARLDDAASRLGIPACDLVKIDVEGAELAVIEGGAAYFAAHSPLVMFEIRDGEEHVFAAARRFESLGYSLYELVIDPPMLVPARPPFDTFRLNLFACKPDRAARLEGEGLLARAVGPAPVAEGEMLLRFLTRPPALAPAASAWAKLVPRFDPSDPHVRALGHFAAAQEPDAAPGTRAGALLQAHEAAEAAVAKRASLPRLTTAARIARTVGRRSRAVAHAVRLVEGVLRGANVQIDEPFLPMLPLYDSWMNPLGPSAWVSAMAIEALWRWKSFSDVFTPLASEQGHPADLLRRFGREAAEFERRRQLPALRARTQSAPVAHPLLGRRTPDNLNPGYWSGGVSDAG